MLAMRLCTPSSPPRSCPLVPCPLSASIVPRHLVLLLPPSFLVILSSFCLHRSSSSCPPSASIVLRLRVSSSCIVLVSRLDLSSPSLLPSLVASHAPHVVHISIFIPLSLSLSLTHHMWCPSSSSILIVHPHRPSSSFLLIVPPHRSSSSFLLIVPFVPTSIARRVALLKMFEFVRICFQYCRVSE